MSFDKDKYIDKENENTHGKTYIHDDNCHRYGIAATKPNYSICWPSHQATNIETVIKNKHNIIMQKINNNTCKRVTWDWSSHGSKQNNKTSMTTIKSTKVNAFQAT